MIVVRQLCRKTNTTHDDEEKRFDQRDHTSCIAAETKRVVS